jgi:hypothetical protein
VLLLLWGESVYLLREGYSEQLFLLTDERGRAVVRKQAKPGISGSLLAEIAWLEELPPSLHRYFPQVLRSSKDDGNGQVIFYDMPYFGQGWVLFSELILPRALDREPVLALIAQVMEVMFGGIFPTTFSGEEPDYPHRLVLLLEHCAQRISQLPAFSHLVLPQAVTVNGVKLWNVFSLLDLIRGNERVREKLRPAAVRKVHGDLHPENILVHVPSLARSEPQVVLLDPIAPLGLGRGDFAMDIAKFTSWLSAELLALRLGLFSLHEERGSFPVFELALHTDDAQLCPLSDGFLLREFARLVDTAGWARMVCDADPQWWQRVSFYEALYALSMVPLVPFPQSLARFLIGLRHLHNFVLVHP